MDAVNNKDWLADAFQVREALARELLPVMKRGHLGPGHLPPGARLPVLLSLRKPSNECLPGCLARRGRRKEYFLQDRVSSKLRVVEVLRQTRFFEVHDVFSSSRSSTHKDHSPKDRRALLRHLLCDHTAKRESEDVTGRYTQAVQKTQGMHRHAGHSFRHLAAGSAHACAFEQ